MGPSTTPPSTSSRRPTAGVRAVFLQGVFTHPVLLSAFVYCIWSRLGKIYMSLKPHTGLSRPRRPPNHPHQQHHEPTTRDHGHVLRELRPLRRRVLVLPAPARRRGGAEGPAQQVRRYTYICPLSPSRLIRDRFIDQMVRRLLSLLYDCLVF